MFSGVTEKRLIQLNTFNVLRNESFDGSLSKIFSVVNVVIRISLTLQHLVSQTCSWKLQVCLSMYDLLGDTRR